MEIRSGTVLRVVAIVFGVLIALRFLWIAHAIFFVTFLAMALVGLLTGLGLFALGIDGAAALGLFAGLLELIPFFGPFVSAVPALGIALADSPQKAFAVALLFIAVQQLEGNLITPLILERRLHVPPVLTIVAVSAMGMVFGVLGMLVAEPILAATLVVTKMLYVRDVVHDDV